MATTNNVNPPPPYSTSNQQIPERGQQYVQQFVDQNPQGFIQTQPPVLNNGPGQQGYGLGQPMQMQSSQSVVVCQPQASPTILVNPRPNSYMLPAILSCFFCCWLIGIGAIIAAAMSESQSNDMNYEEARRTANIAKILTFISMGIGCAVYVGIVVLVAISNNNNPY